MSTAMHSASTQSASRRRKRPPLLAEKAAADLTDHDLLIRLDERVDGLEMGWRNHLRHHAAITIAALSTAVLAGVTLLVFLLAWLGDK